MGLISRVSSRTYRDTESDSTGLKTIFKLTPNSSSIMARGKKPTTQKHSTGIVTTRKYFINSIVDDKVFDKHEDGNELHYLEIEWAYANGKLYRETTWERKKLIEESALRTVTNYFKPDSESASSEDETPVDGNSEDNVGSDESQEFQRNSENSADSEEVLEAPSRPKRNTKRKTRQDLPESSIPKKARKSSNIKKGGSKKAPVRKEITKNM